MLERMRETVEGMKRRRSMASLAGERGGIGGTPVAPRVLFGGSLEKGDERGGLDEDGREGGEKAQDEADGEVFSLLRRRSELVPPSTQEVQEEGASASPDSGVVAMQIEVPVQEGTGVNVEVVENETPMQVDAQVIEVVAMADVVSVTEVPEAAVEEVAEETACESAPEPDLEEDAMEERDQPQTPPASKPKLRATTGARRTALRRAAAAAQSEEEPAAPAPARRGRKATAEPEEQQQEQEPVPISVRRGRKATAEPELQEGTSQVEAGPALVSKAPPARRGLRKPTVIVKSTPAQIAADEVKEEPSAPTRRVGGRTRKVATAEPEIKAEENVDTTPVIPVPAPARRGATRKAAVTPVLVESSTPEEAQPLPLPAKRGRVATAAAAAAKGATASGSKTGIPMRKGTRTRPISIEAPESVGDEDEDPLDSIDTIEGEASAMKGRTKRKGSVKKEVVDGDDGVSAVAPLPATAKRGKAATVKTPAVTTGVKARMTRRATATVDKENALEALPVDTDEVKVIRVSRSRKAAGSGTIVGGSEKKVRGRVKEEEDVEGADAEAKGRGMRTRARTRT